MTVAHPRGSDARSPDALKWRKLYDTAAWQRARGRQLALRPLCERCEREGFIVPATVCNHRTPHKGDYDLFLDPDNLESTCAPCHDQVIQSEERGGPTGTGQIGVSKGVDRDGWPSDPRHPVNRDRTTKSDIRASKPTN